ncbi:hypothetical protein EDC01DRAFT_627078 [Geopyxis carbonaria]|nr:hypothetical protein EDC01DRAFT_627078 [Geopyxis carbonaria]
MDDIINEDISNTDFSPSPFEAFEHAAPDAPMPETVIIGSLETPPPHQPARSIIDTAGFQIAGILILMLLSAVMSWQVSKLVRARAARKRARDNLEGVVWLRKREVLGMVVTDEDRARAAARQGKGSEKVEMPPPVYNGAERCCLG